jgi:hypothetical protein
MSAMVGLLITTRAQASSTMPSSMSKHEQSRDTHVDTRCVLDCKRGIDHRSSIKRVKQGCGRLSLRVMADHCKSGSYHIHATWPCLDNLASTKERCDRERLYFVL